MHFIPSVLVVGLSLLAACSAQADPPSDAIQRTIPAQEGCTDANGVDYSVGDKWQPTACTFCTCTDKLAVECASQNCPVLECPDGQGPEIPAKNQCCPAKCVENPNASNCNQKCDNTWAPVCGTDLTTYNNKCQLSLVACTLNDDTLKVKHNGECTPSEQSALLSSSSKTATATGSSAATNVPALACAQVTCPATPKCKPGQRLSADPDNQCCKVCKTDSSCPLICVRMYQPVCGSDGKTYSSKCDLMTEACKDGSTLGVAYDGECKAVPFLPPETDDCATAPCDANAQPVCASNGKTYSNICELTQTSCELKKKNPSAGMSAVHMGACKSTDAEPTTKTAASTTSSGEGSPSAAPPAEPTSDASAGNVSGSSSSSSNDAAIIAGSVVAAVVVAAVIAGVVIFYVRRSMSKKQQQQAEGGNGAGVGPEASALSKVGRVSWVSTTPYTDEAGKKTEPYSA